MILNYNNIMMQNSLIIIPNGGKVNQILSNQIWKKKQCKVDNTKLCTCEKVQIRNV